MQPEVRANFEKSIETLKGVIEVTRDVEWPDLPVNTESRIYALMALAATTALGARLRVLASSRM